MKTRNYFTLALSNSIYKKKQLKLFIYSLLILFPKLLQCQCINGDVHISNQNDVLLFKQTQGNCDTIFGNLIIGPPEKQGQSRVESLQGFENIKVVLGNVEIRNNQWLTDLGNINNIQFIDGNFIFLDNPKLIKNYVFKTENINGSVELYFSQFSSTIITFPSLKKVGKDLFFSAYKSHPTIFPTLKYIGNNLRYYSNSHDCTDLIQLEYVNSISINLGNTNMSTKLFQKLKKVESLSLKFESTKNIDFGSNIEIDYLSLENTLPNPIIAFSKNKKYKSLSLGNLHSTKYLKETFGNIDSIQNLQIETKVDLDSFPFGAIKYVESAILYNCGIAILPKIKSIGKQLQIRGTIKDIWVNKYLRLKQNIPIVSFINLLNVSLGGTPKINCNEFRIEYNSHLQDIKKFNFVNINTNIIVINDNRIDSINFNVKTINHLKTEIAIFNNRNLSFVPAQWACELLKQHALLERRKYDYIFSGNKHTANDIYFKNYCSK